MDNQSGSRTSAFALRIGVAASAFAAASAAFLPAAHACGGFFCSASEPVNQAAEQIIFVQNADDTVTAVIRINYVGPSEHFAWVLPIAGVPDKVDVSSNQAFDRLSSATGPQYSTSVVVEGTCKEDEFGGGGGTSGGRSLDAGAVAADGEGSIAVLGMGSVGPYDWHVISVSPNADDPAQDAVDWLTMNGYDVTDLGPKVLAPYLQDGLNLIAFKLTKASDAQQGSIRPVMLTFDGNLPGIPIRPTAVAAQDDMGVLVWVLSDKQAVPKNYKSLVLNEALINWFDYYTTYNAVVSAAADEAGGQGFVTELAGPSSLLDQVVWQSYEQQQWQTYSLTTFQDGFDAIMEASYQFRDWDGYRDAIFDSVTLPDGVSFDEFGRNPDAYRDMAQIDQHKFLVELYENVVRPVIRTQELLDSRGYVTRLYSTMSADEMTVDPVFDFNADLADLSNVHTAIRTIECTSKLTQYEAPWRIELPQGGVIRGKGGDYAWPFTLGGDLPANFKIVQLSTRGQGKVALDNSAEIAKALFKQSGMKSTGAATPPPPPRGVPIGGGGMDGSTSGTSSNSSSGSDMAPSTADASVDAPVDAHGGGGCSVAGDGATGSAAGVLFALALTWFLPRRRR